MATKIKLMRMGKTRAPYYRIVVADARTKRDGRAIETIGKYHPKEEPSFIEVSSERAQYWLGVGAQPTAAVTAIFKVTGDWQQFTGEPAPAPMKVKDGRDDKKAKYEAALGGAMGESDGGAATTPKKKAARPDKAQAPKAAEPKAAEPNAAEPNAAEPEAEAPKAAESKGDEPTADESTADESTADESKGEPATAQEPASSPAADEPNAGAEDAS